MPIVLRETFDVQEEIYSEFIHRYHRCIINLLNQFHDGIGVVGPSRLTNDTRWSTITLTNNIGRSIEIVTSLESLWLYGYRRLSDENNILPWRLVSGYTREGNFSSLSGQHESLGFDGKYTSSTSTQDVSRPALNSAITVLDKYAHTPANSAKANDCFLLIVIYFAEALRILPIRDLLCNSFDQHDPVEVGIFNMDLARNWHTISTEFLDGSYSHKAVEYHIHNADDVKEKLWLVYNKSTKSHDLDGVRDSRPGDPGNGDETGPRDSGMGGYSGDGGSKRSGGQGGSKNEGGQPRDRVAGSRSRRPRVGRGRSGNLVHLPLSHHLVGVIQLLSTCASGSLLPAKTLLLLGIGGTLKAILSGSGLVAGTTVSPALMRPPEQIFEIVNLADELLPSLPQGTISLPVSYSFLIRGISRKSRAASSSKQDESSVTNATSACEKLLEEQPELLKQFGMDLLRILTQVYGSSINGPNCHTCLSVIAKLVYYSSADMIQTLLGTTNISSLLAGILVWKDPQVLIPALQIAEILMEKLPGIFAKMFVKEGVVHAIESLICQESSSATPNQVPATDNDSDAVTGTSSRSGQYRRQASGPSMDRTNLDEVKTPPPASDSTDTPGLSSSLHVVVSGCAKSYKEKYFPGDSDSSDVGVTDDLRFLRTLCTKLNACAENSRAKGKGKLKVSVVGSFDISAGVEEQLNEVVAEMLIELSKGDGVSTFEFIGSGAVIALLNYLSCGTFGKEKIPDNIYHKLRQQAIRRYKSFISIALCFDKDGSGTPMMTLVQKLQNALSSLEQFPVMLSHSGRSSSSGGARLSSGLSALSQPFKLRLYRAQGEKSLRDYSSNVMLIDPLASLAAVEDFLWPRIQCTESSSTQKSSTNSEFGSVSAGPAATASSGSGPVARCSTRYTRSSVKIGGGTSGKDSQEASGSANTSSSKGKGNGKAVLKHSSEEPKGLQTINATCRKAASEKDTEMKPAHDNSSSKEDDELDASPVEIDDALMIDEDDISEDEDDYHDDELDLYDILSFDTEFGKILQELQILVHRKKYLESSGDSTQAIDDLRFRGAPIEDLCLDFTLPGYPGYVLKEDQESTSVNFDNLEEYISLVVDATVKMGIARQMESFRTGFNQVFDVTSLQIFSPNDQLDYLICGHRELWEAETLVDHIKFDDGYTAKSPVIVNLLEIMAEFSPEQQHAFCQFVTGAPRLPRGGLAALSPKLTIVRKHPSNVTSTPTGTGVTDSADEDLPSVMTYANYLKLPPYSTKEVMYKKLLYAINEEQGSFDLS